MPLCRRDHGQYEATGYRGCPICRREREQAAADRRDPNLAGYRRQRRNKRWPQKVALWQQMSDAERMERVDKILANPSNLSDEALIALVGRIRTIDTVRMAVSMPSALAEAIESHAARTQQTRARVIRLALYRYLISERNVA